MTSRGYKKYMKKDVQQGHPLLKIFIVSFFGMLLFSTFVINSISKRISVDTSVGDYKEQQYDDSEDKKIVDMNRLEMIQNEDQGKNFSDLMQKAADAQKTEPEAEYSVQYTPNPTQLIQKEAQPQAQKQDVVYKVFIGSYTSSEQAKVAKEIIQESGGSLSPIVKCIGTNEYTLQVGIFKNKQSAEAMLGTILRNNLPGRIVQDN